MGLKVLLVSNYEPDRQYSMLGFASCLQRELPKLGCTVARIGPKPRLGTLSGSRELRKWLAYVDKYVLFPSKLRKAAAANDVVHILDHGNAMYLRHIQKRPHLITCHDLLAIRAAVGEMPGWNVGPTGKKYQSLILDGLQRSNVIACVSEATREDVLRLTSVSPDRVRLVYNGPYQPLTELSAKEVECTIEGLGIERPYLLHVGHDSPYKNRSGLLRIYKDLLGQMRECCPDLVVAGKSLGQDLLEIVKDFPPNKLHTVEAPSSTTLAALYQGAEALLFPSLFEGFGLPILEAQSLGCPVFTTNRKPMTEVGGAAAVYFEPEQTLETAKIVSESLPKKKTISAAGRENARRFSAERMASGYANLYRECGSNCSKAAL